MKPSSTRPSLRRLLGVLTAFAMLLGLGALVPASAMADAASGTYAISGTVTDDTGAPVAGVSVQLSPNPPFGGPVSTDADGHYTVPNVPPGSYAVSFTPSDSGLLRETYDNADFWNPTQVAVTTADISGIDAVLDHPGTIGGRVVDADGNPIPGVTVQLQSVAFVYASATTGADGSYSVSGLRPGDWRVSFTAPNGSPWVSELYDDALTPETQTVVTLVPGASLTLHDAVLARGGTISGRILAPDGTPRAGIEVYASTGLSGGGVTTGADGTYAIPGLADGDYTVTAQSDWGANLIGVTYPGTTNYGDSQLVHVVGAASVPLGDMTLVAGITITGTLFGPDGAPLAGAMVYALSQDAQDGSSTQGDGTFTIKLIPGGTYRVLAETGFGAAVAITRTYYAATPGETRSSQAKPVSVTAGGTAAGIDIHAAAQGAAPATLVATPTHPPVLGQPFTIDVTVTGAKGVPTGSVWVGATAMSNVVNPYADADLDASGHATLTFDAVDQGTYPWVDVYYVGDATYGLAGTQLDYVLSAAAPAPSITSLAPAAGTVLGGEHVAITGTGFAADSTVTFGGIPATVTVGGPTSLVATAPAHPAGPVDVVVTTAGQPSAPATYTYAKVTTSLALSGPTGSTTAGSSATFKATVSSTGAVPTGSVAFAVDGGAAVTVPLVGGSASFSTSTLTAGAHTVAATFAGDATFTGSTAQVSHTVTRPATGTLPVVERATPCLGLTTGGTLTVLTGKNFVKGKTSASFGGVSTTKVTVLSSTRLLVVVPKHAAGVVHVTVTTPAGTSTSSARFTYVKKPTRH